jgi:hypothetical protein
MTPDQGVVKNFQAIQGTTAGLVNGPGGIVNAPLSLKVSQPADLLNQAWGEAGSAAQNAPNLTANYQSMMGTADRMYDTQVNPNTISLPGYNPQSFQPSQFTNPSFGAVPQVSAPGGLSTTMYQPEQVQAPQAYQPQQVQAPQIYTPQQVQAQMVSAPGAINPVTGVASVSAPSLNQYQMGPYQAVSAPTLQNYSMQAAGNVAPNAQVGSQSWTAPGTSQQYMSPYVQNVVNTQLAQAQTQEQQQLAMQGGQAAAAGAFGGSRQAVEAANTSIGYQQLAAATEAQGLQNAYTQGAQQFNTEQQLGMQGQQFNVQSGLQAALQNQQMQQQANTQNLASALQTQQLGASTGLQAQLANQQAGLTVSGQNLGANLQTQQLGATTGLQAALANQAMSNQTQVENQQAQEFGYGQQLQAQGMNQSAGLQAQGMNQSAGLQTGLAEMGYQFGAQTANQQAGLQAGLANMGYQYGASAANATNALQSGLQNQNVMAQLAQFGAGQQMQGQLANQAAGMQAQGLTYQGGLQGALQTQNLGLSGAEYGGSLGLQSAAQQAGLQQSQTGLNQSALMDQGALQQMSANTNLAGYNAQLAGNAAALNAGVNEQNYDQSVYNAQYQNQLAGFQLPMQGEMELAQITGMMPQGYTTNSNYYGTQTYMPPQASPFSQALQFGIGAAGAAGNLFSGVAALTAAKGGSVPRGLKLVRMPPAMRERRGLARAA